MNMEKKKKRKKNVLVSERRYDNLLEATIYLKQKFANF